ncbi:MAG TPA: protein BatD [Porphyromonadaceae bacterium]|jgi:hypothetical protein|nr:protein BatD [Porphyromonadaceae bacterium]HBX21950.1 protein BatD [Porphyromonadaceae bacterium]
MSYFKKLYTIAFLVCIGLSAYAGAHAQVTFKASAPAAVEAGQQFRLSYVLNKEGKDLRLPDIKGFDILFGPTVSSSFSQRIVNGKSSSESSFTYTYILMADKEGTYTIDPASITVDGSTYRSNSLHIKVLPADESSSGNDSRPSEDNGGAAATGTVSAKDAFIRAILSKDKVYEQEGFTVTFRLYTTLNVVDFGKIQFPEFEGFMVEEIDIPANQQLKMEHYNGKNYYTADLRKTLLFPQRSGPITIPSGRLEMVFSAPSGRRVSTFFGSQEVMVDVKKAMVTNPVTIHVSALPANKPESFSGAVGTFTFSPTITPAKVKANEPVTVKLEISGMGNLKLIKNPEVKFPSDFEVYDPTVNNSLTVTTNGFTGKRVIEYLAIPRSEGSYTIPAIEFAYFDMNSRAYRTLTSPAYTVQVEKGDPSKASVGNFVNQQDVKVEQDIRFLKTNEPAYHSRTNFFAGSIAYGLWYLIPFLLFIVGYSLNRKRAKENANVALMRTKKANKVAVKRLKAAEKHLKDHNKQSFYEEILRALWGYFSDKLSIPVANLSKDNIDSELSNYGIDDKLIGRFMQILNTCEFARYAPAESNAQMGDIYADTVSAISEMQSKLKKK